MRLDRRRVSWLVLIAVFALAIVPVTSAVAHDDGTFQHLKQDHFFTKKVATKRFVVERWAVVDGGGTLVRGERALSASRFGEGAYLVTFERDVTMCAYSVTPLAENGAFPIRMSSASTGGFIPADTVGVSIRNSTGAALDGGFSLVVTC